MMIYSTNYCEDLDPILRIAFDSAEEQSKAENILFKNVIQRLSEMGIITITRFNKLIHVTIKDKERAHLIEHEGTRITDCTCPRCGNIVGESYEDGRITVPYCDLCGQKLEWD